MSELIRKAEKDRLVKLLAQYLEPSAMRIDGGEITYIAHNYNGIADHLLNNGIAVPTVNAPFTLDEVRPLAIGVGFIEIRKPTRRLWKKYGVDERYYNKTFRVWPRPFSEEESAVFPWDELMEEE